MNGVRPAPWPVSRMNVNTRSRKPGAGPALNTPRRSPERRTVSRSVAAERDRRRLGSVAGVDDHGAPGRGGADGVDGRQRRVLAVGAAERSGPLGLVAGLSDAGLVAADVGVLGLGLVDRRLH